MRLFGRELKLSFEKRNQTLSPATSSGGGWFNALFPLEVREANPGDWQRNVCYSAENLLANPIVFSCITLISGDIGKLRPLLRRYDERLGIDVETRSPAFSPVLAKPNPYQSRIDFYTSWVMSLLTYGNTYILKVRDSRSVVTRLYVLDPRRVQPLVAPGGEVFYQLSQDNLTDIDEQVVVPASEILHDRINAIFHPLVGLSPLFGCGGAATQGIEMQRASTRFFRKGATPSGIITIPGSVDPVKAQKIKAAWDSGFTGANAGAVAILADGARFEAMTMKSTDSETVNQLKLTNELICSAFHVPAFMVGVGDLPSYNNALTLADVYYSQCLQVRIEAIEELITTGLGLDSAGYSFAFDLRALLRMDTASRYAANTDAIAGGWLTPNEARRAENLPPIAGGDSAYMQQQNFSLAALAKRDAKADPFATGANNEPSKGGPSQVVRLVSSQLKRVRSAREKGLLLLGRDAA